MIERNVDVLIVGAGPAGLSAAIDLKKRGVGSVVVLDRESAAGGTPRLCHHQGFGLKDLKWSFTGPGYARHYVKKALKAGVEILTDTTATEWIDELTLGITNTNGLAKIGAKAILLATGCRERPRSARLIPGSRPQGVFTTGSLQDFVHHYHLPVGKKAVVVGAELVSFSALMTLAKAKTKSVLMVTELEAHQAGQYYRPYKWLTADLLARVKIATQSELTLIKGYPRVEAVEITSKQTGEKQTVACDTVVLTGDWIPDHELARKGSLTIDPHSLGPLVDMNMRTSRQGVFAAGNLLRGAETADHAAIEGRIAAKAIAEYLAHEKWPDSAITIIPDEPIQWVSPSLANKSVERNGEHLFLFRVKEFHRNATLQVKQGDNVLYQKKYNQLIPNLSARFSGKWTLDVDPDGPEIRITLVEK